MSNDWRGGFLFLANHLALDFLNTRPVMDGRPMELLPDCGALARWLAAAGLISQQQASRLKRRWSTGEFAAAIERFRELREGLRTAVFQMESGETLSPAFLRDLNLLLEKHPYVERVVSGESGLKRRKRFAPESPGDAFAPLADAIADLLTSVDRSRIRKCRNCVGHFYDTSKKGTRLWCAMSLCGNRSKVAAFASRKRAAAENE